MQLPPTRWSATSVRPLTQAPPQSQSTKSDQGSEPYIKDLSKESWAYIQVYSFLGEGAIPDGPYEPMTDEARWKLYIKQTYVTPAAYILPWVLAVPEQVSSYPPEWSGFKGLLAKGRGTLHR